MPGGRANKEGQFSKGTGAANYEWILDLVRTIWGATRPAFAGRAAHCGPIGGESAGALEDPEGATDSQEEEGGAEEHNVREVGVGELCCSLGSQQRRAPLLRPKPLLRCPCTVYRRG